METEKSITLENLVTPYSEEGFREQLLSCGIPEASIEEIRSTYTGDDPTDNLLSRLYADIERSETRIIDGERHLQFTGAFVTDGKSVLLERHPDFGKKGYGMGGLFAYSGITPEENMLKEIDEETPIAPVNSRLRLLSETAESSISPRLPDVMSHRTGHFFIYFAGVNGLDDMPEIYQGSDGDPHELYIARIEDIADDPTIAKGWKGDVTKFDMLKDGDVDVMCRQIQFDLQFYDAVFCMWYDGEINHDAHLKLEEIYGNIRDWEYGIVGQAKLK